MQIMIHFIFRYLATQNIVHDVLMRTLMIMLTLSWGCCVLSRAQLLSPPWRHIDPGDVTPPRARPQWPIRVQYPERRTNQEPGTWLNAPQLWPGHHRNLGLEFYKYRTNKVSRIISIYLELYLVKPSDQLRSSIMFIGFVDKKVGLNISWG